MLAFAFTASALLLGYVLLRNTHTRSSTLKNAPQRRFDVFRLPIGVESLVVQCLDTRDLVSCGTVSRLWHHCLLKSPKTDVWSHVAALPIYAPFRQAGLSDIQVVKAYFDDRKRLRLQRQAAIRRQRIDRLLRVIVLVAIVFTVLCTIYLMYQYRKLWYSNGIVVEIVYLILLVPVPVRLNNAFPCAFYFSSAMMTAWVIRAIYTWIRYYRIFQMIIVTLSRAPTMIWISIITFEMIVPLNMMYDSRSFVLFGLLFSVVAYVILNLVLPEDIQVNAYDKFLWRIFNMGTSAGVAFNIYCSSVFLIEPKRKNLLIPPSLPARPTWKFFFLRVILLHTLGSLISDVTLENEALAESQVQYWILFIFIASTVLLLVTFVANVRIGNYVMRCLLCLFSIGILLFWRHDIFAFIVWISLKPVVLNLIRLTAAFFAVYNHRGIYFEIQYMPNPQSLFKPASLLLSNYVYSTLILHTSGLEFLCRKHFLTSMSLFWLERLYSHNDITKFRRYFAWAIIFVADIAFPHEIPVFTWFGDSLIEFSRYPIRIGKQGFFMLLYMLSFATNFLSWCGRYITLCTSVQSDFSWFLLFFLCHILLLCFGRRFFRCLCCVVASIMLIVGCRLYGVLS